jgi:hypothetical protein
VDPLPSLLLAQRLAQVLLAAVGEATTAGDRFHRRAKLALARIVIAQLKLPHSGSIDQERASRKPTRYRPVVMWRPLAEREERASQLEQRMAELSDELAAVQRESVSATSLQGAVRSLIVPTSTTVVP